jgi:hypothetical protein
MKIVFPKTSPKDIEREVETLQRNYSKVMENVGKFVLIQGDKVVAYYRSFSEAIAKGYKLFGLDNFLVREVRLNETPIRAMRCGVVQTDGKLRLAKAKKTLIVRLKHYKPRHTVWRGFFTEGKAACFGCELVVCVMMERIQQAIK